MTNEARIARMSDIFAHRIASPKVEGRWIVWTTGTSVQTLDKFVGRAKSAGIPGVWARDGKVGCLAAV